MTTIKEIWNNQDVSRIMLADKWYKEHPEYKLVNPNLIVGLELEIEGWDVEEEASHRGFSFTSDGSLRGASIEAITKPTYSKFVPHLLEGFYQHFEVKQRNYSERCSTHVHVNCQNLTKHQLRNVCVLYQALERVLFAWIGEEREQNIFCIPWYQCNISNKFVYKFLSDTDSTVRRWQKYTALNLLPIREQGTIEFRHLEGTCDITRITAWLNIIGSIFKYACEVSYKELRATIANMNSVSNYGAFVENVFGEYSSLLTGLPAYKELLAMGIVDCKLLLVDDNRVAEDTPQPVRAAPAVGEFTGNIVNGDIYTRVIMDDTVDALPRDWTGIVEPPTEQVAPEQARQLTMAEIDAMLAAAIQPRIRPAPERAFLRVDQRVENPFALPPGFGQPVPAPQPAPQGEPTIDELQRHVNAAIARNNTDTAF